MAQGFDQFGNLMAAQPALHWSTTGVLNAGAAPTLSASGATETFTFNKAGSYVETVSGTGAGGAAIKAKEILAVGAKLSYITVSQVGGSGAVTGNSAQFTVTQPLDQFHNPFPGTTTVSWLATAVPSGASAPTFATSGSTTTVSFESVGP